jgi:hydrogenase expression/formation protein HypE
MAEAARQAKVQVVTGDTKVVERGHGDGVFVTTAGIGRLRGEGPPGAKAVEQGDVIVVSGPIGDHGAVIAASRSGIEPKELKSDCGPVAALVESIFAAGVRPRFMRDPTRGGLATVLSELAEEAGVTIALREADLPVREAVRGVCDILGLDPLYLACEGRLAAAVAPGDAEAAVRAMQALPEGSMACVIGEARARAAGPVVLATRYGGTRLYDMLASEQLPRIC